MQGKPSIEEKEYVRKPFSRSFCFDSGEEATFSSARWGFAASAGAPTYHQESHEGYCPP
jgi:hypothetical protein